MLLGVVARIVSAIANWNSTARNETSKVANAIVNAFLGVPGRVYNNLKGIADSIRSSLSSAYDTASSWVDKIKNKVNEVGSNAGAWAGEEANGRQSLLANSYSVDNRPVTVEHNLNVSLDLRNVPSGVDTDTLIGALTDRRVLNELVNNSDFQLLDGKAKERLNLKIARSRGI